MKTKIFLALVLLVLILAGLIILISESKVTMGDFRREDISMYFNSPNEINSDKSWNVKFNRAVDSKLEKKVTQAGLDQLLISGDGYLLTINPVYFTIHYTFYENLRDKVLSNRLLPATISRLENKGEWFYITGYKEGKNCDFAENDGEYLSCGFTELADYFLQVSCKAEKDRVVACDRIVESLDITFSQQNEN